MHYLDQGIVTPENGIHGITWKPKIWDAIKSELLRKQHPGGKLRGGTCKKGITPEVCRDEVARSSIIPNIFNHQNPSDDYWPNVLSKGKRQIFGKLSGNSSIEE